MKNSELVRAFSRGETEGQTGRLSIRGDKLFSYAMPIAKRVDGAFEVSNCMAALGGQSVSQTTSTHIGLAYRICKPNTLVPVIS